MSSPRVRGWRWNRGMNTLVASVEVLGGETQEVHIPIERVSSDYAEILGSCGYDSVSCCEIGAMASVDGFLSSFKRVVKKAAAPVVKTVKTGIPYEPRFVADARRKLLGRKLSNLHDKYRHKVERAVIASQRVAKKYGTQAARSKTLGAALGASAIAFPAVGAPALAAWTAANRYVTYADQAKQAQRALMSGQRPRNAAQLVARGQQVVRGLQAAKTSPRPEMQLLMSALKSMPAPASYSQPTYFPTRARLRY